MGRASGSMIDTSRTRWARNRRNLRNLFHPPRRRPWCTDSLRVWHGRNRRNRRNRFHPPRLRRAVAARAREAPAIDNAARVTPDPPSEPTAVDLPVVVSDVVKDLTQLGTVVVERRSLFDGIAHHGRGAAE